EQDRDGRLRALADEEGRELPAEAAPDLPSQIPRIEVGPNRVSRDHPLDARALLGRCLSSLSARGPPGDPADSLCDCGPARAPDGQERGRGFRRKLRRGELLLENRARGPRPDDVTYRHSSSPAACALAPAALAVVGDVEDCGKGNVFGRSAELRGNDVVFLMAALVRADPELCKR